MKTPPMISEGLGISITRDDQPRALASQKIQYPAYKDAYRREDARKDAIIYGLTRAIGPKAPITVDWDTRQVFSTEGGYTFKIATFSTSTAE